jgi:hypothetical protein
LLSSDVSRGDADGASAGLLGFTAGLGDAGLALGLSVVTEPFVSVLAPVFTFVLASVLGSLVTLPAAGSFCVSLVFDF